VSEEVRRRIEAAQKKAAEEEAAGPLSATQIARLQYQAAQLLEPGESVAAGLKRLGGGGRRPGKRSKQAEGDGGASGSAAGPDPEKQKQFQGLTEAAMKLLDAGENDVYSQTKVTSCGASWQAPGLYVFCASQYLRVALSSFMA
jgi:regulator of protease activity HflC (stomatin/prohibitin superfamily)